MKKVFILFLLSSFLFPAIAQADWSDDLREAVERAIESIRGAVTEGADSTPENCWEEEVRSAGPDPIINPETCKRFICGGGFWGKSARDVCCNGDMRTIGEGEEGVRYEVCYVRSPTTTLSGEAWHEMPREEAPPTAGESSSHLPKTNSLFTLTDSFIPDASADVESTILDRTGVFPWTAGQRLLVVAELTRTITEMGLAILAEETPEMPDRDRYLAMLGSPETELRSYFYLALQAACFARAQLDAGYRTPGRCPLSTNDLSPAARSDAIFAWDPNIEETATLGYTTSVREIGVSSRFQDLSDSRNLKLVTEVIVHETTHQLNFYTGRLAYGFLPTDLHYQNQIEPEPGDDSGRHVPGYGNAWLPYHNETTAQLAGAIFMSFQDIDDGWSFWGLSNYYIQYYYYPRLRGFAELLRAGQGTLARDAGTPYIARILSSTDPLRNLSDITRSGCDAGDLNCYQRYLDESGIASMWRAQWELQFEVTGGIFRLWPPCLEYVDLNQRVARCSEAMLEAFYPNQHENEIESPETSDEHEPEGDPPDEDAEAWDAPERADRQASSEGEGESEPDLTICVLDIVMGITTESSAECVNWCWNAFPRGAPTDHWLCGLVQKEDLSNGCRYSDNGRCEAELERRRAEEAREEARRQAEAARRREAEERRRREAEEERRREEEAAEAAREAAWCSGEGSHYTLRYLDQAEDGCWPYIGPTRCCREGGRTHCEPEPGSTNKACGRDGWAGCWTDGREYYEYSRWPYDWYNDLRYGPGDDYEIQEGYHACQFGMYEPGVCHCDCWILGNGIGGWCEYYND